VLVMTLTINEHYASTSQPWAPNGCSSGDSCTGGEVPICDVNSADIQMQWNYTDPAQGWLDNNSGLMLPVAAQQQATTMCPVLGYPSQVSSDACYVWMAPAHFLTQDGCTFEDSCVPASQMWQSQPEAVTAKHMPQPMCASMLQNTLSSQIPQETRQSRQLQSQRRPSASSTGPVESISSMKGQLQALRREDPAAVFIARGIRCLGPTAAEQLQEYFSLFGEVTSVQIPQSRVKLQKLKGPGRGYFSQWRPRAANMGFIVMASASLAKHVLDADAEHDVNGVLVNVHPFRRHNESEALNDCEDFTADGDVSTVDGGTTSGSEPTISEGLAEPSRMVSDASWLGEFYEHAEKHEAQHRVAGDIPLNAGILFNASVQELLQAMPDYYTD